jgi:RND family efflux transporter MFP subunit
MKSPQYLYKILVLPVLLGCFVAGCRSEDRKQNEATALPTVKVTVTEAQLKPLHNQVEVLGTVQAVNRAEIAARISGNITDLPVVLGSEVHKGDLLAEISAGEIGTKLQQARTQFEQARRNLEREKKLLQKNAATPETVKSLDESLRIAESGYREAQIYQDYTRILAPFAGRVTKKLANVGDLATPGKPLLSIENESQLQVIAEIPEAMVLRVNKGDIFSVTISAADLTVPGTVAEVAPTADPLSRTVSVKLNISARDHLHSGQFARVSFPLADIKTLIVPSVAIVPFGQLERVFVVTEDVARLRLVKSGAVEGDNREILSGLKPGEKIVIQGQNTLLDGQPVTLL